MKRALILAPIFVLSGCLLNQTDPAAVLPPKAFLTGQVTVQDMVVANTGVLATVSAQFVAKPKEAATAPAPVAAILDTQENRSQAVASFFEQSTRGGACEKFKIDMNEAPPVQEKEAPKPVPPVSVGRVGFGPALQESLLLLTPNKLNQYQAKLPQGLPPGAYVVVGEGTADVEAFNEILSMPEEVRSFRINGRDFGDLLIDFHPGNNQDLFWQDPAIGNDQNLILANIIQRGKDYSYAVRCMMREDDIPSVSGYKTWTLDKGWFAEFPRSGSIEFYFLRAHRRVTQTKRSKTDLQGIRTYYSKLDVKP
jgi:hypothetical protein